MATPQALSAPLRASFAQLVQRHQTPMEKAAALQREVTTTMQAQSALIMAHRRRAATGVRIGGPEAPDLAPVITSMAAASGAATKACSEMVAELAAFASSAMDSVDTAGNFFVAELAKRDREIAELKAQLQATLDCGPKTPNYRGRSW